MTERSEDYVVAHVQEALARDPRVHELQLRVSVVQDRVHVSGVVPTEERRVGVEAVLRECCPDMEVENRVTVGGYEGSTHEERVW